jgi:hypothetical protein
MNCLWINDPQSCYGSGFLLNGFAQLGWNVTLYPPKPSYCGRVHEGYAVPGIPYGVTAPHAWNADGILPKDTPEHTAQEVKTLLRAGFFDLIMVESCRWGAMNAWAELEDAILHTDARVILHDGEDFSSLQTAAIQQIRPDVLAKREWLRSNHETERIGDTLIVPCPFSAPDSLAALPVQAEPFAYDVVYLAGRTWPARADVASALIDAGKAQGWRALIALEGDKDRNLGVSGPLPWHEYIAALSASRCGVSVRGHGYDCVRYWETACTTGLVCDDVDIHIPHPFTAGADCLILDSAHHAAECIQSARDNGPHYQEVRAAGIAHARRYHTNSARARYILKFVL